MVNPSCLPSFTSGQDLPRKYPLQPCVSEPPRPQPLTMSHPAQRNQVPWKNEFLNQRQQPKRKKPKRITDPFPTPYRPTLTHLIQHQLVKIKEFMLPPTPFPLVYDANTRWEFHSGAPDHSIENCRALKNNVQDLIELESIAFTPKGLRINWIRLLRQMPKLQRAPL